MTCCGVLTTPSTRRVRHGGASWLIIPCGAGTFANSTTCHAQLREKSRLATAIREPRELIVPGRENRPQVARPSTALRAHGEAAALFRASLAQLISSLPEDRKFRRGRFRSLPLSGPLCFNDVRSPGPRRPNSARTRPRADLRRRRVFRWCTSNYPELSQHIPVIAISRPCVPIPRASASGG